jgi:hypothetical protein
MESISNPAPVDKWEDSQPVIMANYNPLRFVLRPGENWDPTIKQINGLDYDYAKLHRVSLFADVGIAPFTLGFCFDGTLVLPAIPQFRDRGEALAKFNAVLTELLFGGITAKPSIRETSALEDFHWKRIPANPRVQEVRLRNFTMRRGQSLLASWRQFACWNRTRSEQMI